ncbi:hypothetical protein AB0H00_30070 [Nocardia sp. NPDC023852]|uniref:hypothetical protein n=1 Tax=Nocardia sp. NPDC023852 TaxID=3154697 RepID=UPI0033C311E7
MPNSSLAAENESFGVQTARQAVTTASVYEKAALSMLADLRSSPQIAAVADALAPGIRDATRLTRDDKDRLSRATHPTAVNTIQAFLLAAESVREWQQHRVVYRVHPELVTHLGETAPGTAIPCEVFRRLPHPDPFVVFPVPLPAPHSTGDKPVVKPPVYIGMLVTGFTNALELCSTADERLHILNVSLIGRVQAVGAEPQYPEYSIRIPCMPERFTIDEMIKGIRYVFTGAVSDAGPNNIELNAYRLAVSLLLYLCSDRRDIRTSTNPITSRKKRRKQQPPTVVDVGFDIGPKLFAARNGAATQSSGAGKPVRSHIRRAHWHTYWTGPQYQRIADVRWLHPILINPADRDTTRPMVIDAEHPANES